SPLMKHVLIATVVLGAVVAVGVITYRLSTDALALIVGVGLGFLALVPTVVVALVLGRRQTQPLPLTPPYGQPPVIVVSGGQPLLPTTADPRSGQPALPPPAELVPTTPRRFRVLGLEALENARPEPDRWSDFD
ncbi:MAG: hypothetical protein NZP34_16210, partial [Caldilineales bacterium]|nr:hypothetical protein [Caldilineales bacterium]